MQKHFTVQRIVFVILLLLSVLYVHFGDLATHREQELAQWTGDDELSRQIRTEADEYRILNRNQQRAILAVGAAVVLVASIWRWIAQRNRASK
jgi:hypothetical protein